MLVTTTLRSNRAAIWILMIAISVVGCQCTFPALAEDGQASSGASGTTQSEAAAEGKSGQSEEIPIQLQKLTFAEQLYFGRASNDPSAEGRLTRLEKALYGRSKSGSFEKRFARIDDALGVETRMRQARLASSGKAVEPLKVYDRVGDRLRTPKEPGPATGGTDPGAALAKTGLGDSALTTPELKDKAQESVAKSLEPTTIDGKPVEPTMASKGPDSNSADKELDAKSAASKPLDAKLTSKPLSPKETAKALDPKLTTKPQNPADSSKPLDPKLTARAQNPKETSKQLDPKLTSKPLNSKEATKPLDQKLASKVTPKLAKPLEPKTDSTLAKANGNTALSSASPSPAQLLLKQGMAAHRAGNHQVAEDKFKQVLSMEPRNADAFFNLGALAETRGDLIGALTHYRAALGINPLDRQLQEAVRSIEDQVANQSGTASGAASKSHTASSAAYNRPPVYDVSQQSAPIYNVSQYPPPASTNPNAFSLQTAAYGANLQNQPPIFGVSQQTPPIYGVSQQPPPIYNVSQFPPPVVPVSSVPHCPVCHVNHNQPPTHGLINAFLSAGGGAALGPLHCPICRLSHMGW
jgi:tetratricopeptide (TPR) repeat protein